MRIERVQIEEGFLDGLDVSFAAGLNVLVAIVPDSVHEVFGAG